MKEKYTIYSTTLPSWEIAMQRAKRRVQTWDTLGIEGIMRMGGIFSPIAYEEAPSLLSHPAMHGKVYKYNSGFL